LTKTELGEIEEVCAGMREFFERILGATSVNEIAGACLHASILLQQSIDKFCRAESVVRGGDGHDGGLRDVSGQAQGHYWVEGVTESGIPYLADITGDQFGWPSVVVLPLQAARERYLPGDDAAVGALVEEELQRMLPSTSST
jgi:hypothetical protein